MPVYVVAVLMSLAALWLVGHRVAKRRFARLRADLAKTHMSALAVPPQDNEQPRLALLAVDLLRGVHCTDPFEQLNKKEQRLALHAHGLQRLPRWVSRYGALWLPAKERAILGKLQLVSTSRPQPAKPVYNPDMVKLLRDRRAAR